MIKKRTNVFTLIVIFLSFLVFILPHTKLIDRPLFDIHDQTVGFWATVVHLWRTEGIVKHHFVPVYNFPPVDLNIKAVYGVHGYNGRLYYVSYGPLSFWLAYLASFLPGVGVSIAAVRLVSIGVFITTIAFLFFYLYRTCNLSTALFSTGLFSFVPLSLYYFGGIATPEIVRFAFWIPSFVFLSLFFRSRERLYGYLYFLSLGLLALTEWVGFLTAAVLCFYFCLRILTDRNNRKTYLFLLVGTGSAALIALTIILWLFLSVSSFQDVLGLWRWKSVYRGGFSKTLIDIALTFGKPPTILDGIKVWFSGVINNSLGHAFTPFFWLMSGLLLLVGVVLNRDKQKQHDTHLIVIFFILVPFLQTVLLLQAYFFHDFLFLSYLPAALLVSAKGFFVISKRLGYALSFVLACSILALFYKIASSPEFDRRLIQPPETSLSTIRFLEAAREATRPDDLILTDYILPTDRWFYIRRNAVDFIYTRDDLQNDKTYNRYKDSFSRIFYTSDTNKAVMSVCGLAPIIKMSYGWICRIK